MTPELWIGVGTGAVGIVTAAIGLIKARPEVGRLKAETAKVYTEASASLVASVNSQMEGMRAELAEVKQKLRDREDREDRQERLLLVHERWDLDIAHQVRQLGGHVADPPPLYPDSTAA